MKFKSREYTYRRELQGGCFVCYGDNAHWFGPNTQGVAVRHHDATGHETWVDIIMSIHYGVSPKTPDKAQ